MVYSKTENALVKQNGTEPVRTAFRSPWQNGIAERWVGSVRRDLLDHVIVLNPLDKNGFGLSVAETDRLARVTERDFEFLPDSREVHDRGRSLLVARNIQSVQVHDARLAASMYVHGVGQLLTTNVRDFRR